MIQTTDSKIVTYNNKVIENYIDVFTLQPITIISAASEDPKPDSTFFYQMRNFKNNGDAQGLSLIKNNTINSIFPSYQNYTGTSVVKINKISTITNGSFFIHLKTPAVAPISSSFVWNYGFGSINSFLTIDSTNIQFYYEDILKNSFVFSLDTEYFISITVSAGTVRYYVNQSLQFEQGLGTSIIASYFHQFGKAGTVSSPLGHPCLIANYLVCQSVLSISDLENLKKRIQNLGTLI